MPEAIVFLPDMMSDATLFRHQMTALSAHHAVMAAPVSNGERIEEIASGLLDQLPMRFALVGLGLGASVALELMRRAPDRISRVCLISASPLAETPVEAADREPLIIAARAGRLDEAMQAVLRPEHLALSPARREILSEVYAKAQTLGPELFIRQMRALQRRRDHQSTLRRCAVPMLVLCGEVDGQVPVKRHAFMAELVPHAEFATIPGAGHLPPLEAPEIMTEALKAWLKLPLVLR